MVRASGVFNSISDFGVAVVALARDKCELRAIRMKDRVTEPLANGYRDVLINFLMDDCDLILELQLVSSARCDAMRCDAMRCDAMRCGAMRCDTIRYDTIRYAQRTRIVPRSPPLYYP